MKKEIEAAVRLFSGFYTGDGVFGGRLQDMPFRKYLKEVPVADRLAVLTITTVMDYQTSAERLWNAALLTYRDEDTGWLFDLKTLAAADLMDIRTAMSRHGYTGTFPNVNSDYIRRVARTILDRWPGVMDMILAYESDAESLYRSRKDMGDLPSLSGDKVFPLWLRTVGASEAVELSGLENIPVPVDVHVARASCRLLYASRGKPEPQRMREKIESDWKVICSDARVPGMCPVTMYEPLWFLSHSGCSGSDDKVGCKRIEKCPVARWCVFGGHS